MKKVTALGGVFFKSKSPRELMAWYREHLGIQTDDWGGAAFEWRDKDNPQSVGQTVFTAFKQDTEHFAPASEPYMFNFRVDDLAALLTQLKSEGVQLVGEMQDTPYGKFGWIMDPEGRKIELWQPSTTAEDEVKP